MLPNPILTLGPLKIHMYSVMICIGVLCGFALFFTLGKKRKISEKNLDFVYYTAILSIFAGFAFAALFHAVYAYIERGVFELDGSITFLGGLIGAVATATLIFFLFRKKYPTALRETIELIPVCVTLGHAFGRVGCFFAGCCYGIKTDSFIGVKFPNLPYKVVPTQLIEAGCLFILFAVLLILYVKKDSKHLVSIYLISYGVFRFVIEFFRGDDRGAFIGSFSPSQFWSLVMIVIGIAMIFLTIRFRNWVWGKQDESEN